MANAAKLKATEFANARLEAAKLNSTLNTILVQEAVLLATEDVIDIVARADDIATARTTDEKEAAAAGRKADDLRLEYHDGLGLVGDALKDVEAKRTELDLQGKQLLDLINDVEQSVKTLDMILHNYLAEQKLLLTAESAEIAAKKTAVTDKITELQAEHAKLELQNNAVAADKVSALEALEKATNERKVELKAKLVEIAGRDFVDYTTDEANITEEKVAKDEQKLLVKGHSAKIAALEKSFNAKVAMLADQLAYLDWALKDL